MEYHELANIFPLLSGQALTELVDDIAENGQREPIWIYEGKILDGRNRWRACELADVEPLTKEYAGSDPLKFVVSLNLHRRHLNESQRAMVAAKLANMGQGRPSNDLQKSANLRNFDQASAAEMLNVGKRSLQMAKRVEREGAADLIEAVESGRVAVSNAAEIATLPKEEQSQASQLSDREIIARAKEIREIRKANFLQRKEEKIKREADKPISSEEALILNRAKNGETVVINMNMHFAVVKWAKENGKLVQIDRYSDWGNPFILNQDGDRGHVCDAYKRYYQDKRSLHNKIEGLRGKVLSCHCHPLRCHGDELIAILNEKEN